MTRMRSLVVTWLAILALLLSGCGAMDTGPATGEGQSSVDSETGLQWVDAADLPPEADDTLELIDAGGPFPYDKDGSTFGNFEGILPEQQRGFYREYTVETPGLDHRGPLRIVTGGEDGSADAVQYFWTEDHYESFERIRR